MLKISNDSDSCINIIGIDPGTTHLGFSVLEVDLITLQITSSIAYTLNGSKLSNEDSWLAQTYGDRFNRIRTLERSLLSIFYQYTPTIICAESPFFGLRHPNAFQALTEVICAIRNAVYHYDVWMNLKLVPPSSVKQAVFAKGNATKTTMKDCLTNLMPELNYNGNTPFNLLDEHSIDSLAVGYYAYTQMKNGYV